MLSRGYRKSERPDLSGRSQKVVGAGESGGNNPYVGAGVGWSWRYMMYALIEPVLANSFQKISEVRIGQRYPF